MTSLAKLIRWILVTICALEGLFFLFLSYIAYGINHAFQSQWVPENLRQNIVFLSTGLLFVIASYLLFRRRPSARYLSAFLFCGLTIWVLIDTFSRHPPTWSVLYWAAPPGIAFLLLLSLWTAQGVWRMEKSA
jgi:glucose dehydrogenase